MKVLWVAVFAVVLVWSGVNPKDYATWVLEVAPAVIAFGVLAATQRSFPSRLSYTRSSWCTVLC